jgi:hypothetical protein
MSFVINISVMRKMYNFVAVFLDEGAIIFIYCTLFLTTNCCNITQGSAITGGMATSFGLGALGFDSRQGQGIFFSSKVLRVYGALTAPY